MYFYSAKIKAASIFDFNYTTDLDEEYNNAVLNVETTLRRYSEEGNAEGYTVDATLFADAEGNEMFTQPMEVKFDGNQAVVQTAVDVEAPKWSAEAPNLYQLVLSLKDAEGNIVETAGWNCPIL